MNKPTDKPRIAPSAHAKIALYWLWVTSLVWSLSPSHLLAEHLHTESGGIVLSLPAIPENFSAIPLEGLSPGFPDPDELTALDLARCAGFMEALEMSGAKLDPEAVSSERFTQIARHIDGPANDMVLQDASRAARLAGLESLDEKPDCSCHLHLFLACQRLYTQNVGSDLTSP
ncbi:hypothetical protein [Neogemmobacter tilapiae]|uniref:hypothetical protein n=1 Tax=Neogemmobacter tilapiae TaxID=875041 RepID=UPI001E3702BA|nr:hypothetical protein [Gemmobacter tilapiae]